MSDAENMDNINQELDNQKKFQTGVEDSNADLEKSVVELEGFLRRMEEQYQIADDVEWKVRYDYQIAMNIHLNDQKQILEGELAEMKWKADAGAYPTVMNFNLEKLHEREMVRLVKHLERLRTECFEALREVENKVNKEHKEFQDMDDMRRTFKTDLKHIQQAVERNQMEKLVAKKMRAVSPPLYSPAYTDWLDTQQLTTTYVPADRDDGAT